MKNLKEKLGRLLVTSFVLMFIAFGCEKSEQTNDVVSNKVDTEIPFSADFKIFDSFPTYSGIDELIEGKDKLTSWTSIYFKASYKYADNYLWILNGDTINDDSEFSFRFDNDAFAIEKHKVELIVENKMSDTVLVDRSVVHFSFAPSINELNTVSKFKGVFSDSPNDSVILELGYGDLNGQLNVDEFYLVGFDGLEDTVICISEPHIYVTNNKSFIVDNERVLNLDLSGTIEIFNDVVEINYKLNNRKYKYSGSILDK